MTPKKGLKIVISICAIFLIVYVGLNIFLGIQTRPVDKTSNETILVEIKEGSITSDIASKLNEQGLIRSTFAFQLKSKLSGYDSKYKAGSYALAKNMNAKEIMKVIASGKAVGNFFQVTEGDTIDKIAEKLEQQKIVTKEEFLDVVENGEFDYRFMEGLPEGPNRLEGFLFPDTYSAEGNAYEIVNMMLENFDKNVTDEYYKKAKENGHTIYEIITIASIIEKEAKTPEDKEKVASVIYNRLNEGMYLQMDSIISYIQKEDKIRATYDDIKIESLYNPYKNLGLPPGPICSPGQKAIEAALNPAETSYLYFVASEKMDGSNVFSVTYEDFLKDKAKFDKAYEKYIKENPGEQ